jgi:oligopeptide transport system substrate-binding protein
MAGELAPTELGIKAIDEKTVEITLNTPCGYFTEICAFPACYPVRKDIIEQYGDQWTQDPDKPTSATVLMC